MKITWEVEISPKGLMSWSNAHDFALCRSQYNFKNDAVTVLKTLRDENKDMDFQLVEVTRAVQII